MWSKHVWFETWYENQKRRFAIFAVEKVFLLGSARMLSVCKEIPDETLILSQSVRLCKL